MNEYNKHVVGRVDVFDRVNQEPCALSEHEVRVLPAPGPFTLLCGRNRATVLIYLAYQCDDRPPWPHDKEWLQMYILLYIAPTCLSFIAITDRSRSDAYIGKGASKRLLK